MKKILLLPVFLIIVIFIFIRPNNPPQSPSGFPSAELEDKQIVFPKNPKTAFDPSDQPPVVPGKIIVEGPYERIHIVGENAFNGVFDPSIEYDNKEVGWMVYSSVNTPSPGDNWVVQAEIAKSEDNGKTWTKVRSINPVEYDTVKISGIDSKGHWNKETNALLYDPEDPDTQKRWKLFSHRIFSPENKKGNNPFYSVISYLTAPSPGGPWSKERYLFGSSKSQVPDLAEIQVDKLDNELSGVIVVTEPGPIAYNGVIYISMNVFSNTLKDVILLSSKNHGENWTYVDTTISRHEAEKLGYDSFDHSGLVQIDNKIYLFAAPKREKGVQDGTFIFKFTNIEKGLLEKEDGKLKVYTHLKPGSLANPPIGESEYHEQNTGGGVIFPDIILKDAPKIFQIFNTGYKLDAPRS